MKAFFALIATVLVTSAASAGSVNMTCQKAQNHYDRYGRINVKTGSGAIVPIYGLFESCSHGYTESPYWVRATDDATCVLGYRCIRNSGNN